MMFHQYAPAHHIIYIQKIKQISIHPISGVQVKQDGILVFQQVESIM